MKDISVGSTFSGIGSPEFALKHIYGDDFERKVHLKWACDFEMNAKESFLANHNPDKFYDNIYYMTNSKKDIMNMPDDFIKKTAKQKVSKLEDDFFNLGNIEDVDLYIFGFPCQNFSHANKNRTAYSLDNVDMDNTHKHQKDLGYSATKTTLVFESMKIIEELSKRKNPLKYFIAENVKGLVQHDPAYIWDVDEEMTSVNFEKLTKSKLKVYRSVEVDGETKYYKRRNGLVLDGEEYNGYPSLVNKDFDGKKKFIGKTLYVIENAFIELGYEIEWKVLNAKDYSFGYDEKVKGGVQNRERIFIVGVKEGLKNTFEFPIEEEFDSSNMDKVINYLDPLNNDKEELLLKDEHIVEKENKRKSSGVCNQTHFLNNVVYEQGQRIYSAESKSPCLTCVGEPRFHIKENDKDIFRSSTGKEMLSIQGFPVGDKNRGKKNKDGTFNIKEFKYVVSDSQLKKQAGNSMSVSKMKVILEVLIKMHQEQ